MTTTISFTAARDLDVAGAARVVIPVLMRLPRADRYVTGGARGGDAFIGRWLYRFRSAAEHIVVVPANRAQVDPWWEEFLPWRPGLTAIGRTEMPDGTTYKDRNQALVDAATWVFGFPAYTEHDPRSIRSGTWQSIRMARAAGNLSQWHCVKPPYPSMIEHVPDLSTTTGDRRTGP